MDNFQSRSGSDTFDDSEQNNHSSNDEVSLPWEMIELDEWSDMFNIQIENIDLLVNTVIGNLSLDFQQDIFRKSRQESSQAIGNNANFPTFSSSTANATLDLLSDSSTTLPQQTYPLDSLLLEPLVGSELHTSEDREEIGKYLSNVSALMFERDDTDSNILNPNLLEHIEKITSSSYEQNDVESCTSISLPGITSESEERRELQNSYELHVFVDNAETVAGDSCMNAKAQYRRKGGSFISPESKKECHKKSSYEAHYGTHTKEKSFPCEKCGKRFTRKGNLEKHNQTHTGKKPYSCSICTKRFSYISNVYTHQRIHTGERPYPCDMCEKRFNNKSNLKAHQRTHTGERPYPCNMCEKRFNDKSFLNRHQRTHTGERPYPCEMCEKRFNDKSDLKRHQQTHTVERPYSCALCEKRFKDKRYLKRHQRFHTRERPYTYDSICAKNDSMAKVT